MVPQKRPSGPGPDHPERSAKHPRIETSTTNDKAISKHAIEPKDDDRLRRLRGLNRSVMSMFEATLEKDPGADLSTLLENYAQVYPDRRKRTEERASKALTISHPQQDITTVECETETTETTDISSTSKVPSESKKPKPSREERRFLRIPQGAFRIIRPLTPSALALFTGSNGDDDSTKSPRSPPEENSESFLLREFSRILSQGVILWHFFGKGIVKLSEAVIVKIGTDIDLNSVDVMNYIKAHTKKIPMPVPLGVFAIGKTFYSFMSTIEGTKLEKRWPGMSDGEKYTVQTQLNAIMKELRQIPPPSPDFGLGWNGRCKDTRHHLRRHTRQSELIANEPEFNDFLLSDPLPRITKSYLEMMRSRLRDDHRIVLTHGDLRPRNIMVAENLTITGLIAWEMSGWYPEYWEYLKALNTFSAMDSEGDDWWQYLPECIGPYHAEWALDRQLETMICCQ